MYSDLVVELYVIQKNYQDLFKESNTDRMQFFELDKHAFLSLEGLLLAGLSGHALGPARWRPSRLKKHGYPVQKIFIQSVFDSLNES